MSEDDGADPGDEATPDAEGAGDRSPRGRGVSEPARKRLELAQADLDQYWDDVISDLKATAAEYEERGWDVEWTQPGDVTLTTDEAYGDRAGVFVVTVPGSGYEAAGAFVDGDHEVTSTEVFRATTPQAVFLVVALEDEADEAAFLFPLYYTQMSWSPVYAEGTIYTRIRHVDGRAYDFGHDDPELFAPPEPEDDPEEEDVGAPGGPDDDVEPPEPSVHGAQVEDLSELTPEELSELSLAELRSHNPSEFAALSEEQLAALDVPQGMSSEER